MTKIDDYRYKAADGCFIVRKEDDLIMGEFVCLGNLDSIENYEDREYTEESYRDFYNSIREDSPKYGELKKKLVVLNSLC